MYDVVDTGAAAPNPNMISATRTLPFDIVWNFQFREFVDIYIYAQDYDGRVDFDTDAPYTDVYIQDQTTPPVQLFFQQSNPVVTTLTADTAIGDRVINVVDGTLFTITERIILISELGRFYSANILGITVNAISVDSPLDFAFTVETTEAISSTRNMDVDGSTTTEIFTVRGVEGTIDVPITLDITRVIGYMVTTNVPDFGKFGDIVGGLLNGLVLRKNNGRVDNIHNLKINGDIANLCYDLTTFLAANPGQGVNGLTWRMSFAGQDKHGVTIRLGPDETLEYLVQDDLTDLLIFRVAAEGHIVD
jgi:hypothetical protein